MEVTIETDKGIRKMLEGKFEIAECVKHPYFGWLPLTEISSVSQVDGECKIYPTGVDRILKYESSLGRGR